MHPFGDNGQSGVPAFLAKLWRLVDDSETNNLISWSSVCKKIYFTLISKMVNFLGCPI